MPCCLASSKEQSNINLHMAYNWLSILSWHRETHLKIVFILPSVVYICLYKRGLNSVRIIHPKVKLVAAPLTSFSANTTPVRQKPREREAFVRNIQLYYHQLQLWMSSWRPGKKAKLLKQICVCCVVRRPCHSLSWAESQSWSRGVAGWKEWGRHQHSGRCHQAPSALGAADAPTGVHASLRDTRVAYTHTPSVLESHWQPLHKHKEANSVIARISPLGGRVCVFAWLWTVKKSYIKPDWKCLIDFGGVPELWGLSIGNLTWVVPLEQGESRSHDSHWTSGRIFSSVFLALPRLKSWDYCWTDTKAVSQCVTFSSSCSYFFFYSDANISPWWMLDGQEVLVNCWPLYFSYLVHSIKIVRIYVGIYLALV